MRAAGPLVWALLAASAGAQQSPFAGVVPVGSYPPSDGLAVADVNGDGVLDLLHLDDEPRVDLALGTPQGDFLPVPEIELAPSPFADQILLPELFDAILLPVPAGAAFETRWPDLPPGTPLFLQAWSVPWLSNALLAVGQ